jgi:acetyl-CoA carboxylase biotin carboxyl carrier protein
MDMNIDEIRELIQAVTSSGIAELEVQRGDNRVKIRRMARQTVVQQAVAAAPGLPEHGIATHSAPHPVHTAGAAAAPAPAAQQAADVMSDPSLVLVKSPIVGTFYESPAPGSPPFVRIGDSVQPGKVLCIIESMKLMNEIEAEHTGTIVSRLVENGHAVEYGEALFAVRPL